MKIVIGLLIVVALVVGVILALPFLIDLNKYQDQYKPLIEDALNRKVQLQDIRLTIWPRIGARVAGFVVLDDPAFGSSPFTSLTSLDVGVKLLPLLSGKVEVEEITLRDPVITVIKNKNGVLNISTIGRTGVECLKLHRGRPFHRPKVRSKSWHCWPWIESPSRAGNSPFGICQLPSRPSISCRIWSSSSDPYGSAASRARIHHCVRRDRLPTPLARHRALPKRNAWDAEPCVQPSERAIIVATLLPGADTL